jgi:hypothetical protein
MDYFKSDGNDIYLEADAAEFYIPSSYFKSPGGFAEDLGDEIKTLGIFDVGIFDDKDNLKEIKVFNVPSWINIYVNISEERSVPLPGKGGKTEVTPCKVLKFLKGHKIMSSTTVQDSSNVEAFLGFLLKGKLPPTIPYDASLNIWQKNQEMNGAKLGVPSVIEELILSGIYRYKDDPSKKFANVIGADPKMSQFDYVMYNVREICRYTSTFTAITFEDLDSMITTSLNRTRNHAEEIESPVEMLLKL